MITEIKKSEKKETQASHNIDKILPGKYRFLDEYESLKLKIKAKLGDFSQDEFNWFFKIFESKRNKKRNVSFVETIPIIVRDKNCAGFLACLLKNPGIKLSDIATSMGIYSRAIQRVREKLEKLELIVIHYEPITEITKCYLNDGSIKKNGYPSIPSVVNIILEMMESKHGKDAISKLISRNVNVQNKANKKYMGRKRSKKL